MTQKRGAKHAQGSSPKFFPAPPIGGTGLPFSEAVLAGATLYVSGQVGNLPGSLTLAPGGIVAQARQAMENMKAVLERHGCAMKHVVKCTVFLADMADWQSFNRVYVGYFKGRLPARSALASSGLALGARVEIECIAHLPRG